MKIALLLTGNELMSGDTVDTNSAYIAQSLKDINFVPHIKQVVGDDMSLLVNSISQLSEISDVLIVNGGLGPTVDDLTSQALGKAAGSKIIRNQDALAGLTIWAKEKGFELTPSNLKQAELPAICDIIENPVGSASGFKCELNGCLVICTPGPPNEFKPMVENNVLPLIKQKSLEMGVEINKNYITRLRTFGLAESSLQDSVNKHFPDWPANVELGFRVAMPIVEIKICTVGENNNELNQLWTDKFCKQYSDYIIGRDSTTLPQAFNKVLLDNNKKIAIAESCTGGLIASMISSEAGSSAVFEGGFVTYSNEMKANFLDVSEQTLERHGAVSEQCVKEMVQGVLSKTDADIGLAISGIAGPDGGTKDKPVGTIWVAWGEAQRVNARKLFLPLGRNWAQRASAAIALDLVRRQLLGLPTDAVYYGK